MRNEAATWPGCKPVIIRVQIAALTQIGMSAGFTAYIPPARQSSSDPVLLHRMHQLQGKA